MLEISITYTRQDLNEDFFPFNAKNPDMVIAHAQIRNDLIKADGFIAISFIISDDKLSLTIVTLWKSIEAAENFKSLNSSTYNRLLAAYSTKNGIIAKTVKTILPDTAEIKAQKYASRMTISEATTELISILGEPTNV